MYTYELIAIGFYFIILLTIGFFSYRRNLTAMDFLIGNRSLNYWLTALAAHASDMSIWLFMGYPALVYSLGMFQAWAAIGLTLCMFLNWQFIAPKIRVATEQYNSLTFSSFFESRLADTSGVIRIFTAAMSLLFYTIYISSGLVGLGHLLETLFQLNYYTGTLLGILFVIPYVFIGGYRTLAWIDLFQGIFLMCVIIFVPLYIIPQLGGWSAVASSIQAKNLSLTLFPDFSGMTWLNIFFLSMGWGIGYFGQPHIVTKFMGIRNVHEISKSKFIGISWMILSIGAATLVGLTGIAFFDQPLANSEEVFIRMVQQTFHPLLIGFMLCGVLATTINGMSSQVLVLSTNLSEDFYKKIFRKTATSGEILFVSRLGVLLVALIAFTIAYGNFSSVYSLVFYAWSGLGASFGPLLILSLYSKKINKYGAWAGILSGGLIAAIWPFINSFFTPEIPSLLPGFSISFLSILAVSYWTRHAFQESQS